MEYLVRGQDVLFNLAGQVSHIDSMTDPFTDLEINCRSQLSILEAVRKSNPELKIVYAGTRQIYGKPQRLPVDETHLLNPTDVNGINKISGEMYHLVYHSVYGIRASSLRLTNTYGPRQLIRHNRQGFIGWFMRQAMLGEEIQLFGDGSAAPRLRLRRRRGGRVPARGGHGRGGRRRSSTSAASARSRLLELAELLIEIAGRRVLRAGPLPAGAQADRHRRLLRRRLQDPRVLGWSPRIALRDGPRAHPRLLPRPQGALPVSAPEACPSWTSGRTWRRCARRSTRPSRACSTRAGSSSAPRARPSRRSWRRRSAPRDAVAVANGTEAIQLALEALGVGPGDEVVTSPLSAAFTALAIARGGATPVFADLDPRTLNVAPAAVARVITPRTKALLPVHLYGHPADLDPAPGPRARARHRAGRGRVPGRRRALQGPHRGLAHRPGRALLLSDQEPGRLRRRRCHPRRTIPTRGRAPAPAAQRRPERPLPPRDPGHEQPPRRDAGRDPARRLRHLPGWTARRRADRGALPRASSTGCGRRACRRSSRTPEAVYHLFVVRHPRRDALMAALEERGVGTLIHYPIPLHLQPALRLARRTSPATSRWPSGRRARSCRCPSTRRCATSRSDACAAAVRERALRVSDVRLLSHLRAAAVPGRARRPRPLPRSRASLFLALAAPRRARRRAARRGARSWRSPSSVWRSAWVALLLAELGRFSLVTARR